MGNKGSIRILELMQQIRDIETEQQEELLQRIESNPNSPHVIIIYDTDEGAHAIVDYIQDKMETRCFYVALFDKLHKDIGGDIICALNEHVPGYEFDEGI